jgi:signal transduction histidine kinase
MVNIESIEIEDEITQPGSLRPKELEAVYAISQAVATATEADSALEQIIRVVRPVFIFDNLVLYERNDQEGLEPTFARAIGRGRAREADLAWGETTALSVYQKGSILVRREELDDSENDRINLRYSLGLPLKLGEEIHGALVFIRFGGPEFSADQIHLSEFVAVHVAQLLDHRNLVAQIAELEARRQLDNLQDEFVAMISHELLTPLGFIKGYATTLMREDTTWEETVRREFLTIIDEEADKLRELIENLMDSSKLKAGTMSMTFQPVRMDTLLKDISLRSKSFHENLQIDLKILHPGLQISADPSRLAQVFDNLIGNAVKYAPGSRLMITMDKKDDQSRIILQDFGPGISGEHIDKIFNRFYRINQRQSVRGSGLGLYICRMIVEGHQGSITAESTPGKGTTFTILIPCGLTP